MLFRSAAVGERRLALLEAVRELVEKAYPGGVAKHDVDTCVRVLGAVVDGGEISLVEEEDAECTLRVCLLLMWKPEDRGRGARRAAGGVGRRAAALFSAALGMSREVQQQVDKRDRLACNVGVMARRWRGRVLQGGPVRVAALRELGFAGRLAASRGLKDVVGEARFRVWASVQGIDVHACHGQVREARRMWVARVQVVSREWELEGGVESWWRWKVVMLKWRLRAVRRREREGRLRETQGEWLLRCGLVGWSVLGKAVVSTHGHEVDTVAASLGRVVSERAKLDVRMLVMADGGGGGDSDDGKRGWWSVWRRRSVSSAWVARALVDAQRSWWALVRQGWRRRGGISARVIRLVISGSLFWSRAEGARRARRARSWLQQWADMARICDGIGRMRVSAVVLGASGEESSVVGRQGVNGNVDGAGSGSGGVESVVRGRVTSSAQRSGEQAAGGQVETVAVSRWDSDMEEDTVEELWAEALGVGQPVRRNEVDESELRVQLERQRRRVAGLVLDAERLERDREAQRSRVQREIERRRIEAEARCVEPDRREQGGADQVAARRATAMLERARSERARRAEQERRLVLERVQKRGRLEQRPESQRRVQPQWVGSSSLASMREVGGMCGAVEEWQGVEEDMSGVELEEMHASSGKVPRRMQDAESYVSSFPVLPPITGRKRLWREWDMAFGHACVGVGRMVRRKLQLQCDSAWHDAKCTLSYIYVQRPALAWERRMCAQCGSSITCGNWYPVVWYAAPGDPRKGSV